MTALFAIAHIAGRRIAIEAGQIDSVVDLERIVAVPLAPPFVRGVAALRSRIVTVIDPCVLLGVAAQGEHRRAIVSRIENQPYAILVQGVDDIAPFVRQPLVHGLVLAAGWAAVADGAIECDGEAVLILDLHRLVPVPRLAA